ncbi:Aste57867_15848 [Aphanomyces stellatus]|uniref:Aste57867_15848 protein n=1 Tax=Aphanomyces stellatus TaxID=120398 RepID=A0A485L436_9STRA|nr:hypothetical protein As57867_015792 [Aphanomyces stellatus]VFT92635.1 Aste57867_15848 [Aphanomyces stellatus]
MTLKKHTTELEQIKAKSKGSEANSVDTGVDEDPCDSDLTTDNKWSWAGAVWGFLEANAHQADTVHDDNHGNELEWVVDSGATHHMCFVKSMFVDLVAPNASTITTVSLPNGGKGDVEGIGTCNHVVKCSQTGNIPLYVLRHIHLGNSRCVSAPKPPSSVVMHAEANALMAQPTLAPWPPWSLRPSQAKPRRGGPWFQDGQDGPEWMDL